MSFWEGFNKYVGIQGILAVAMGGGYIASAYVGITLPAGYTELMSVLFGFYFAKNGVGIVAAARGVK